MAVVLFVAFVNVRVFAVVPPEATVFVNAPLVPDIIISLLSVKTEKPDIVVPPGPKLVSAKSKVKVSPASILRGDPEVCPVPEVVFSGYSTTTTGLVFGPPSCSINILPITFYLTLNNHF